MKRECHPPIQVKETKDRHSQLARNHPQLAGLRDFSGLFSVCFPRLPRLYPPPFQSLSSSLLPSSLCPFPFQTVKHIRQSSMQIKHRNPTSYVCTWSLIKRSELCLYLKRFLLNSWRTCSTAARSSLLPRFGSNSQNCLPIWLFTLLTLSSSSFFSETFSFHILTYSLLLSPSPLSMYMYIYEKGE